MKRRDLIRYVESQGCVLFREGSRHSIYKNLANGMMTAVPRHLEIKEKLVQKICDDLGIPRRA
jgi:predicted RNA binding protein YcfA (HicA-like mRNA interferase family)